MLTAENELIQDVSGRLRVVRGPRRDDVAVRGQLLYPSRAFRLAIDLDGGYPGVKSPRYLLPQRGVN